MDKFRESFICIAKSYMAIKRIEKNILVDFYNENCLDLVKKTRRYRMNYDDSWCAMFASVCAFKLGLTTFPYEVSVYQMCKLAKEKGTFYKDVKQVKKGDLIIYNWNGDSIPDHIGIIQNIRNGVITTIEGNFMRSVNVRTLTDRSPSINGFIKLTE